MRKSFDPADLAAGLLFILFGAAFGASSLGMEISTAFRMGPGYAPLVLAGLLTLLGVLICASALRGAAPEGIGRFAWRGMAFLLPAPILFGLTVRPLGFVPAIFLATLLASFASSRMRWWQSLALAVAVTAFATLVFSYGLGLPFRRLGPWLDG
jgi:hypothetical protein